MDLPRALTTREREVLSLLLPRDGFADVDVYRAQLDDATVTGGCSCGCATICLAIGSEAPRATPAGPHPSLLAIEAHGKDPSDPNLPVGIILFAKNGALDSLEIVYFGDTPPKEFPATERLEALKLGL
jgi:hypothetical protein